MKLAKKITLGVFIALLLGAVIGLGIWVARNYSKITSETDLYTYEELLDHGEKRYEDGLQAGEDNRVLVEAYLKQLREKEAQIDSLSKEVAKLKSDGATNKQTIETLEALVEELQGSKVELEAEVRRLQNLVDSYDNIASISHEVEFYINNKLFYNCAVQNGKTVTTLPEFTEEDRVAYMADLTAWTVNGELVDSVEEYVVVSDTTFVATFENVYAVTYDLVSTQDIYYVTENETVQSGAGRIDVDYRYLLEQPQKTGYAFTGWTLNGEAVAETGELVVSTDMTFVPTFKRANKLHSLSDDNQGVYGTSQYVDGNQTVMYTVETIDLTSIAGELWFAYVYDSLNGGYGFASVGETVETTWGSFTTSIDIENNCFVWNFTTTSNTLVSIAVYNLYELTALATVGEYELIDNGEEIVAVHSETGEEVDLEYDWNVSTGVGFEKQPYTLSKLLHVGVTGEVFLLLRIDELDRYQVVNIDSDLNCASVVNGSGEVVVATYEMLEDYSGEPVAELDGYTYTSFVRDWNGGKELVRFKYADNGLVSFTLTRIE